MPTDQMPGIDAYRRAQRQTNTVQADRLMLARLLKHGQSSTVFLKKISEFNEVKRRQRFKQVAIVRIAPANANRCGKGCRIFLLP